MQLPNLGSAFGLGRAKSRIIGLVLMGLGFFLATPPGFIPDDFLDVIIGDLVSRLLGIPLHIGILLTYTVIAYLIFLLGAMIYPYNTMRLLNGFKGRLIALVRRCFTDWRYFLALLFGVLVMIWFVGFYQNYLIQGLMDAGLLGGG
jgi:hypothetical protein